MKKTSDNKNIFKRDSDTSKIKILIKNISPLFYISEFFYILFLRYNDYILSTTYKEKTNEEIRKNIYNILILLYFLKPFMAFLTDNVHFNLNNILVFLSKKIFQFYNFLHQLMFSCSNAIYKVKYYFFKIFFRKYLKDGLSGSRYLKKSALVKKQFIETFLYLPLNRKYYVIMSEFLTSLLLVIIYLLNERINYYFYLITVFLISSQMLLTSCVFEGVIVEKCKKQMHFENIFYISYVMCVKIFSSLILYYIYIVKVSIFILIIKSFIVFLISYLSSEELLLTNNLKIQHNIALKCENGNMDIKNTTNMLSQLFILKKILFNENLLKTLFLLMLFNSSIDTKFSILQYGVQNYNWPHSLVNYIPLASQSSKLIGISVFQLYTNKKSYKNYAMIIILFNLLFKIFNFTFLYYNKNAYVSPFLFLLNIIVQNISIKILALPILFLCIEKAPLNLESTIINIYIFCFNLSNLISKRYFIWNIILQVSKNVFTILLLSFLTTCASLFYYFNISLDSLSNINSSSYIDEKEDVNLKLSRLQKTNYFKSSFFNKNEKKNSAKKSVRFKEDIQTIKCKDEENKNKTNLFKLSSDYNSDSDQWLIVDNLKGNTRRKYREHNSINFSNMML
ncbi:conserved Plasmodium membrane protein, unknown function [Plasmodium gallinaceum]|uniref:Uncharacterized protein n=1 Tax=Plasmodium gallinaceum TaxID=5849 RepID=A0A1J1GXD7_PLAGA|nr:conserved Plasmodium membrane protein, unknown function [Plasmodium gallinaceum]CRG97235.1 conserved Plasmodium membrane protein, unknown function [Plasmodium gallinaceum]